MHIALRPLAAMSHAPGSAVQNKRSCNGLAESKKYLFIRTLSYAQVRQRFFSPVFSEPEVQLFFRLHHVTPVAEVVIAGRVQSSEYIIACVSVSALENV